MSPYLKEGCPNKNSVFHLISFRIIIPGNASFPLPPSLPGFVLLCQICECRYGSASKYAQHHEQLLQSPNKHSTNVSRSEKFETTSSCGPLLLKCAEPKQEWNRMKLNKWITLLTSKYFPIDVWVGEETSILLLLWLLRTEMLVGISSLYVTFPKTTLWPWTLCRFGERNCPSHTVQILISFRNMLRYQIHFFLLWQELWLYW